VIFSLTIAITIGCIFSLQSDPRPLLKPRLAKRLTALIEGQKEEKNINIKEYSLLQSGSFILGEKGKPIKMTQSLLDDTDNNSLSLWQKWDLFINNVQYELRELGGILILGSAIAASIQVFVPREIILNLGQGTITSIVAMMILAAVVSICSTVDSFFILSFASTFTTASLVAFLVFGPMIDIKSIGLMLSIFKPRMILYLTAIAAQLTFIFTLSYSYFY